MNRPTPKPPEADAIYTYRGYKFLLNLNGGWDWETDRTESNKGFLRFKDALADARRYADQAIEDEEEERRLEEQDRRYGTEREQVEAYWKATRL